MMQYTFSFLQVREMFACASVGKMWHKSTIKPTFRKNDDLEMVICSSHNKLYSDDPWWTVEIENIPTSRFPDVACLIKRIKFDGLPSGISQITQHPEWFQRVDEAWFGEFPYQYQHFFVEIMPQVKRFTIYDFGNEKLALFARRFDLSNIEIVVNDGAPSFDFYEPSHNRYPWDVSWFPNACAIDCQEGYEQIPNKLHKNIKVVKFILEKDIEIDPSRFEGVEVVVIRCYEYDEIDTDAMKTILKNDVPSIRMVIVTQSNGRLFFQNIVKEAMTQSA